MKITRIFMAILIIIFASVGMQAGAIAIDKAAPDFTLLDHKGKEVKLSDFKGKYVVLEWINFGCPFVKKHYKSKNMQMLQEKYTGKDVVWLSICSSAPGNQGHFENSRIGELINNFGYKGSHYLIDESGEIGKLYGAKTTPDMRIINPEGILIYAGAIDNIVSTKPDDVKDAENYVAKVLDAVLAGEERPMKVSKPYGCSVKYAK